MTSIKTLPWLRISTESFAIVASILLAFAIDAWWANREAMREVEGSLQALHAELERNLEVIDRELAYRNAVIESLEVLNQASETSADRGPDQIDTLLGDLTWVGISEFSTGALESLLQSGLFGQLESQELRQVLASLPALYEFVIQFERSDAQSTASDFNAYLSANGSFNQVANTTGEGRPGTGEFAFETDYRVNEARDHRDLLDSDEFLAILTQKHWDHGNVVDALERLKPQVERAVALITQHIQR
jgi:hypothetical protein